MPTIEQMRRVAQLTREADERVEERKKAGDYEEKEGTNSTEGHTIGFDDGRIGKWHPEIYRAESRGD